MPGEAAGHPGEGQVFLRVPVYVAETEARARAEPEESIMHFYRYLGAQLAEFGNPRRGAGDRGNGPNAASACKPSTTTKCCAKKSSSAPRLWSPTSCTHCTRNSG